MNGRPGYPISSTYWLSGIFAVAATFDAGQKIRRREQWETAIAEKKRELHQNSTAEDPAEHEAKVENLQETKTTYVPSCVEANEGLQLEGEIQDSRRQSHLDQFGGIPERSKRRVLRYVNCDLERSQASNVSGQAENEDAINRDRHTVDDPAFRTMFLEELKSPQHHAALVNPATTLLDQTADREQMPMTAGGSLKYHLLAPESIYLTRAHNPRERMSPKKEEIRDLATGLLQLTILRQLQHVMDLLDMSSLPDDLQQLLKTDPRSLTTENRNMYRALKRAWKAPADLEGYGRGPSLVNLGHRQSRNGFVQDATAMNQQLYSNFLEGRKELQENSLVSGWRNPEDDVPTVLKMLVRTVHILNTSPTPPDLRTYNILIAGFSDHNLKTLTHQTITTLKRCNLRPNETTVATILQHYLKYGDQVRFDRWVELLNGSHGGLALAPYTSIDKAPHKELLKVKPSAKEKIIQLQLLNPKVLAAMVAGTLHYHGIEAALEECSARDEQEMCMSMDAFGPLLRDCADRGDTKLATKLWSRVCDLELKAKHSERMVEARRPEPLPKHVFAAMLDLYTAAKDEKRYADIAEHARSVWPGEMDSILSITRLLPRKSFEEAQDTPNALAQLSAVAEEMTSVEEDITPWVDDVPTASRLEEEEEPKEEPQAAYARKRRLPMRVRWQDIGRPQEILLFHTGQHQQDQHMRL